MSKIIEFQIDSSFYSNIVNISDKEITNCPCTIHINENEIEVPLLLALSGFTSLTHEIMGDITLREFTINVDFKYKPDNTFFDKIVELLYNHKISLNEEEVVNLACFGESVNNRYFLIPYEQHFQSLEDTLSVDNCFELLHKKHEFHLDVSKCTREITIIATNFETLKEKLVEISNDVTYLPVLIAILTNENLKLLNEDSLLKFVLQLCEINREYEILFEYVYIEYCTVENIKQFVKYIDENVDTTQHIRSIIRCMSRHLIEPNIPKNPNYIEKRHEKPKDPKVTVLETNPPHGILYREFQKGNVEMSCSSLGSGDVTNLVKDDTKLDFYTKNSPNSWIEASLKGNKPFVLMKYMIRGNRTQGNHLRCWKLEGRKESDGQWIELDKHENEPFGHLITRFFSISCRDKLTAVKLTQTNTDTSGNNYLYINAFDIFGEYYE